MEEKYINKREAARILHEIVLLELKEEDEKDWEAALELKDLYDCHTCVWHIAQMYAKGVIPEKSNGIFGGEDNVSPDEMEVYKDRLFHPEKRLKPEKKREKEIKRISREEYEDLKKAESRLVCVDVRAEVPELERGFINIPLRQIELNPYCVTEDMKKTVVFKCQRGYLATIAATLLQSKGYKNIYVLTDTP